jgi:hypothetical protein
MRKAAVERRREWDTRSRSDTVGDGLCIEQMRLVAEILNLLKGHGVTTVQLRHINAVIEAANRICDEFGRADQVAAPGSGLVAWACSDSVGMSSVYMGPCFDECERGGTK